MNAAWRAAPLCALLTLTACGGGGGTQAITSSASSTDVTAGASASVDPLVAAADELAASQAGAAQGGTGTSTDPSTDTSVDLSADTSGEVAAELSEQAAASGAPTVAQRTAAATKIASQDASCTGITPFYWEIGNASGRQASGTGGKGRTQAPTASTVMPVASASKWVFASGVIEQQAGMLSTSDVALLSMRGGYTNFDSCSSSGTVATCLGETGRLGGSNGDQKTAHDGKFFYGGGHMQVLAQQRGLGPDNKAQLGSALRAQRGMPSTMSYVNPQLAGGLATSAAGYAQFLRLLLNGSYANTARSLGNQAVCTHPNGSDCATAVFSPINQSRPGGPNDISDERWHYSLGHWVEDDPSAGDGAFSSPGRFGFYPWVDRSKTWYGVLARVDTTHLNDADPQQAPYNTSMRCGRKIRAAWIKGG